MGWYLRGWANWVLDILAGQDGEMPEVARPMVKHWGRAVIGKFGAHGFTKQDYGTVPGGRWSYEPIWDIATQSAGAFVELGGRRWKCLSSESGDNCYPAILAYVESHTRARLSRLIDASPEGWAVCCDTDGITGRAGGRLPALPAKYDTWPLVMRPKHTYRRMRVIGPQHVVKDGRRSYSGVPGSAVQTADGSLHALVWPRLSWQLREHAGDGYKRPVQTYVIGQSYASGWVTDDGAVLPVEMRPGPGGQPCPVPWSEGRHAAAGRQLAAVQAPSVLRVFGR
jgi:hypothetical protein